MSDRHTMPPTVLGEATSDDLLVGPKDIYEKIYYTQSEALIEEWRSQCNQDRSMRGRFATWVFILASGQIIFMITLIILIGFDILKYPGRIIEVAIPSMLTEIFGMAFLVVKFLFTKTPPPFSAEHTGG